MKKLLIFIIVFLTELAFADETISIAIVQKRTEFLGERFRGINNFIVETVRRTNVDIESSPKEIKLNEEIFNYPFLILLGRSDFTFSQYEAGMLRDYLQLGGTILIDNSGGVKDNPFDISVRREFKKVFPEKNFEPIPFNHVLFRTFYLLKNPSGRLLTQPFLEGINLSNRYCVIYSMNDLFGALAKDEQGRWIYDVYPGDETQRELALRLAINIIMYTLTLDYKDDQVHKPFILRRQR